MSTVDVSKIRPGDKVTVEATVLRPDDVIRGQGSVPGFKLSFERDCHPYSVRASLVRTHTPAPREIKVGELVTYDGDPHAPHKVIGRDGEDFWLRDCRGRPWQSDMRCTSFRHYECAP